MILMPDILQWMDRQIWPSLIDVYKRQQKALIIGGGIGVPPLVQVAKQLHEQGVEVEVVVGFATKEAVILEEELSQVAHVTVTTDDGSYGTKGYVSTLSLIHI